MLTSYALLLSLSSPECLKARHSRALYYQLRLRVSLDSSHILSRRRTLLIDIEPI